MIYYCCRDHQVSDRESHKEGCKAIKKARVNLEREEEAVRKIDDPWVGSNLFETQAGHFWGIHETRPYMRARFGLVDALLNHFDIVGARVDTVQTCLDHLKDMLRLCRGDNMGLRDIVPALLIRLGKDQEAYDFMKWYATTGQQSNYDWGDTDLPFLDVVNADVFESPEGMWTRKFLNVGHALSVTLVKVRVLIDLRAIQNANKGLGGVIPQEIIDLIRGHLSGNVIATRRDIIVGTAEETARLIETIEGQIRTLYAAIDSNNKYVWRALFNAPATDLTDRPSTYSMGSEEEATLAICQNYYAWAETPGAVDFMWDLSGADLSWLPQCEHHSYDVDFQL